MARRGRATRLPTIRLLEAEAEAIMRGQDAAAGLVPAGGARRGLFTHELAARTNFAAVDDAVATAASRTAARLEADRTRFVDLLAADLEAAGRRAGGPGVLQRALDLEGAGVRAITGAGPLIDQAIAAHAAELAGTATAGARMTRAEAIAQGRNLPDAAIDAGTATQLDLAARRLATAPHADVLTAAREAAIVLPSTTTARDAADTIVGAARGLSAAPLDTYARSAATGANGLGRQVAAGASTEPARIYASELLDSNTCAPCSLVDGVEYSSLAEARADYPTGQYRACEGGARCRGILVFVWGTEADPTIRDDPPPRPLPPAPPEPPPAPPADPRGDLAAELGVTVGELRSLRGELRQLRTAGRLEGARAQEAALGRLERAEADAPLRTPGRQVYRVDPVTGQRRLVRRRPDGTPEGGEYDWLEQLHPDELKRLHRDWFRPGGGKVDEVADAINRTAGFPDRGLDEAMQEWLHYTRQADAGAALARGRLPSPNTYGGRLNTRDLAPELDAAGWDVDTLFGPEDRALAHVLEVRRAREAEWAARYGDDAGARIPGVRPEDLPYERWQSELDDLAAAHDAGRAVDLERWRELIPDEFTDAAGRLDAPSLHALIRQTRRRQAADDLF